MTGRPGTRDPQDAVLRTPDRCFAGLPDYGFEPRYTEVDGRRLGPLRVHYVDAGPADVDPVVLLHGQPTWSYLWRHVIADLVVAGHRVVAPDLIGFGRSDKPARPADHTFADHVRWTTELFGRLDLRRATLVVHDWGGPIGLSALGQHPDRFSRVVATNTIVHTSDPSTAGEVAWSNHDDGHGHVVLQHELIDYVLATQRMPEISPSLFVRFGTSDEVAPDVLAAYDAPYPDQRYTAGPRQLPVLIPLSPNDPGAAIGRATWEALSRWERPFLTAYSDADPATRGWAEIFRRRIPGAAGIDPVTIAGGGHFVQEDRADDLAAAVVAFIAATDPR